MRELGGLDNSACKRILNQLEADIVSTVFCEVIDRSTCCRFTAVTALELEFPADIHTRLVCSPGDYMFHVRFFVNDSQLTFCFTSMTR